jgi:WS/DGAT/MGAT family acyltransferase
MSHAKKLSSMDASFLYLETPEMPMHVGSMAIFKLKDGYKGDFYEDFKKMISDRIHVAPILKARLEKAPLDIDNPSWVEDDQFDINRHIFRASLAAPHDRAMLERTVGWIHAKLLNRARPLWEFYVFEGMDNNEVGLYSKMHHACIDGGAGAALTNMIYDITPVPREFPKVVPSKPANEPRDIAANMLDSYTQLWRQPLDASKAKSFDLPRSGKSDLGSVLRSTMRCSRSRAESECWAACRKPSKASATWSQKPPIQSPETALQAWCRLRPCSTSRFRRAQFCRNLGVAAGSQGNCQEGWRQAERRGAGAVQRRAAPIPDGAGRIAEPFVDGGGADLIA